MSRRAYWFMADPCVYCGMKTKRMSADHIQPRSLGGGGWWENMAPACKLCNRSRGNAPLLVWLLAMKAAHGRQHVARKLINEWLTQACRADYERKIS